MTASIQPLLDFLSASPTPFHAVANIRMRLDDAGFQRLFEHEQWQLGPGKYYVIRNDSSLIAFAWGGEPEQRGFRLVGAHTDSPCLKIKPNAISESAGYFRLGVEVYGGALLAPWFDRDLGLAGRISYADSKGAMHHRIIRFDRRSVLFPVWRFISTAKSTTSGQSIARPTYRRCCAWRVTTNPICIPC